MQNLNMLCPSVNPLAGKATRVLSMPAFLTRFTYPCSRTRWVYKVRSSSGVRLVLAGYSRDMFKVLVALVAASVVHASPTASARDEPDPSLAFSVHVNGQTFVNKVCFSMNSYRACYLAQKTRALSVSD